MGVDAIGTMTTQEGITMNAISTSTATMTTMSTDNQTLAYWAGYWNENHAKYSKKVRMHLRINGKRTERQDEQIADALLMAWKYFSNEHAKGNGSVERLETCIYWATVKVLSGRTLRNGSKCRDIHSQAKKGHCSVEPIGTHAEFLLDSRASIPDVVATKLDFDDFMSTLDSTDRIKITECIAGETTADIARKFNVSPSAISQTRRKLADRYREFCNEGSAS